MTEFEGLKVPPNKNESEPVSLFCAEKNCAGIPCTECLFTGKHRTKRAKYIATHLTPITELYVPFGMLSEEKQEELKKAEQGTNIQVFEQGKGTWKSCMPAWWGGMPYRLNPEWKAPEKKQEPKPQPHLQTILDEIEELKDHMTTIQKATQEIMNYAG